MARASQTAKTTTPVATKAKLGRPKKAVAAISDKSRQSALAPKLSKDELRAQVDKLELTIANLRTKSRETNKAAKAASARIAELEAKVASVETAPAELASAEPTPAKSPKGAAKAAPVKRKGRPVEQEAGITN